MWDRGGVAYVECQAVVLGGDDNVIYKGFDRTFSETFRPKDDGRLATELNQLSELAKEAQLKEYAKPLGHCDVTVGTRGREGAAICWP